MFSWQTEVPLSRARPERGEAGRLQMGANREEQCPKTVNGCSVWVIPHRLEGSGKEHRLRESVVTQVVKILP